MADKSRLGRKMGKAAAICATALALTVAGGGTAFATASAPFGTAPTGDTTPNENLLKTYGVRAGSAGPDFLGITNTNYDVTPGKASSADQFLDYLDWASSSDDYSHRLNGLAIWGSSVNENANPYYANILYHAITGEAISSANVGTTWMSNPGTSAWGDSNNSESHVGNISSGETTIAGLEYSPDIIYGANKTVNWNLDSTGSNSNTNFYTAVSADSDYNPLFVNNDSTNIWTQVYTMGKLATAANGLTDGTSKYTRYNNGDAEASALDYERAIRGQLLYVAKKIDEGDAKKTVAYLYSIDADGAAYFFVPEASGLVKGDDTGKTDTSAVDTADANYAANNGTIDLGWMAVLPFVTNTFKDGTAVDGGIVMKVEDIYKSNPAVKISTASGSELANVDVLFYNTTTATDLAGTSGGKNESNVSIASDYSVSKVQSWAAAHGFKGTYIAGDDFGTSTNQGYHSTPFTTDMAPYLYCERNYTADKDTRAAWAFAKVYPEYYDNNSLATYGYWVNKVYHVSEASVAAVVNAMTNNSTASYSASTDGAKVLANANEGYVWWETTGKTEDAWKDFAYYNGSSRASYYGGGSAAEEATDEIGIFQPSALWAANAPADAATLQLLAEAQASAKAAAEAQAAAEAAKGTADEEAAAAKAEAAQAKADADAAKAEAAAAQTEAEAAKAAQAKAESQAAAASATLAKVKLTSKTKSTKSGKVTVAWKKVTGASGYQVKVGSKTYTVKKAKTVKKTVKATKGAKVKVRVRAYAKKGTNTLYGPWSKIKTVKVKK